MMKVNGNASDILLFLMLLLRFNLSQLCYCATRVIDVALNIALNECLSVHVINFIIDFIC
jgi:hypothetical protein